MKFAIFALVILGCFLPWCMMGRGAPGCLPRDPGLMKDEIFICAFVSEVRVFAEENDITYMFNRNSPFLDIVLLGICCFYKTKQIQVFTLRTL